MILKPEIETLLLNQIEVEWYAHYFYSALSSWADTMAFEGLKTWARGSSNEELEHAHMFEEYLIDRGGKLSYTQIEKPPYTFTDYTSALRAALTAEQATSAKLESLAKTSLESGDFSTFDLASNWIRTEQVKSEKEIQDYLIILSRNAPIDLLDKELFKD